MSLSISSDTKMGNVLSATPTVVLDWIVLSSVLRPRQHSIGYMGDGFYRSQEPTNSVGLETLFKVT